MSTKAQRPSPPTGSVAKRPCRLPGLLGTLAAAGTAAGALLLAPLAAGASEGPTVSSSATAFSLTAPKFALTTGYASSDGLSDGALSAEGAGVLQPAPSGKASASAAPGRSETAPESCGGALPSFPAPFTGLVTGKLACGTAAAKSISAADGTAQSSGTAGELSINLAPLLTQVVTAGSALQGTLKSVLGQLPPIPAGGESVSAVLSNLPSLPTSDQTIGISIGASTSTSKVGASSFTTTAAANGSTITILPGAGKGGAPLAKIMIGGASATATVGSGTKPVAKDEPALVTVVLDTAASGPKSYSVVPGQSLTILSGTPLQSTIKVASGSVTTAPSGAETATADGVEIHLAEGLGASPATSYNGGLDLTLASAKATGLAPKAVVASHKTTKPVAKAPSQPAPPIVANATTPHTGLPWAGAAPLLGAGALTGAGLLSWPWLRRRLRRS